ncbi:MAG: SDR family oxidoreductase [Acidimicrobiia bacterium]|nr:SDR family oxidoreductase [Acidimicrobiia bacterium]
MASIELNGSRVLVLGGSGVLGGEIARKLRERKARVALAGRDEARLRDNAVAIGGIVPTIVADLIESDGPQSVVDQAIQLLDGLDGIVNAAGTVAFGDVDELEDSVFYELIASNLTGPIRAIREAARRMDGGFVVSISGLAAEMPVAGMAAYSGSKAALSFMARAMGRELRRKGIHVLDARPPHTETGLIHRSLAGEPPQLPKGLDPRDVAFTIIDALEHGRRELSAADFAA